MKKNELTQNNLAKGYKSFLKKVKKNGYNPKDIWYSKETGFLCFPPFK